MFGAVDDVIVTKSTNTSVDNFYLHQYTITFSGPAVAGNVPQVRVIDLGENGCWGNVNGIFGQDVERTLVESFVPLYKVQNTADLAYNATAEDVKAAIESLGGACTVDVSRSVRGNGYEWLITFSDSSSNDRILRPMRPNAVLLDNIMDYIDTEAIVVPILRVDLTALKSGVPYYVRAAAINDVGVGGFRVSSPTSLQPSPQTPGSPRRITATALSDAEILVQWEAPLFDGGEQISEYALEWDISPTFDSAKDGNPMGAVVLDASDQGSVADVQAVRISIDDGLYLAGSFSLKYSGQTTNFLSFDAPAADVEIALESLCTIGDVSVTRTVGPANGGYTWLVTIMDQVGWGEPGDGQASTTSALQTVTSHKLSVDGENLLACGDASRSNCWSDPDRSSVGVETQREVQRLLCRPSSEFNITFMGETTDVLSRDADAIEIEKVLENLYSIGDVTVTGACGTSANSFVYVVFENDAGDLPPLSSTLEGQFEEVNKGTAQVVVGRKPFSYTIGGVPGATPLSIRVSAYNRIGYSEFSLATHDATEMVLAGVRGPSIPGNIAVEIASAQSAWIYWGSPGSDGGAEITEYMIQVDTNDGFDSTCGDGPEIQTISVSSETSALAGETFNLTIGDKQYMTCQEWNTGNGVFPLQDVLRSAGGPLEDVIVTRGGDGSAVWDYGYVFSVTFIHNADKSALADIQQMEVVSCGTGTDSIVFRVDTVHDGTGTEASACRVEHLLPKRSKTVLASETKGAGNSAAGEFGYLVTGLTPGMEYRARVAAVNSVARSPWRFVGYPGRLEVFAPVDVPNIVRNATVTPKSKAADFHVRLGHPVGTSNNGANGLPLQGFRIEMSRRIYEVQAVSVIFSNDTSGSGIVYPTQGSYSLTLGNATTWCLDWNSSAEEVELALDSLPTVDGVRVDYLLPDNNYSVHGATSSRNLFVSFTGSHLSNGDEDLMALGTCAALNAGAYFDVYTVTQGVTGVVSPVVTVSTSATNDATISGYYILHFGYRAELNLRLGEGDTSVYVSVDAGSRTIRCSSDLSHYISPHDLVEIQGVELVVAGDFKCEDTVAWDNSLAEYPCTFTVETALPVGAIGVPIFGASNGLGSVHVNSGSNRVWTDWDLTNYLIAGDMIVIRDPASHEYYSCVIASVASTSVLLEKGYPGSSSLRASAFFSPFVVVPFDASAEELRDAIESLPSVGSAEVSREGPDEHSAFTWIVELTSFNGALSGAHNIRVSSITTKAVEVTGCDEASNGQYIATGDILNGRMRYKLVDYPSYIQYDSSADNGLGLWVMANDDSDVTELPRPDGAARDTMLPPNGSLSSWDAECIISLTTSPIAILDGSVSSTETLKGVKASFSSLAKNAVTTPGEPEVQEIQLGAMSDALDGTFLIDFADAGSVTAAWDTSAADMEVSKPVLKKHRKPPRIMHT